MRPEELIARFEGCRLEAYQDEGGVWTIGYGCTGPEIGPGLNWSQAQADAELAARVAELRARLGGLIKPALSEDQYAAVCSLAYNIGPYGFSTSTVLRRINAYDFQGAADAFLMWDKIKGEYSEGLANRRKTEAAIFLDGTDQTPPQGTNLSPTT